MQQNLIYGLSAIIIGIIGLWGTLADKNNKKGSLQSLYKYMVLIWSVISIVLGLVFLIFICFEI